jgi:quinoprotein glucose dehydrogenase
VQNRNGWLSLVLLTLVLPSAGPHGQQPSTKNGERPYYTADLKGAKYSPLDQINADNFNQLEVVWRFKTDNFGTRPEYKPEGAPNG